MGCKSSKPDCAIVVSSVDGIRAVPREKTYQLLAELRSLGVSCGPAPALVLDESCHRQVSLAVAGAPELKKEITKNPDLLAFVNAHLEYAIIPTLRSLAGFKGRLDKVQDILSIVSLALLCFEREEAKTSDDNKKKQKQKQKQKKKKCTKKYYSEAVEKLKESRAVDDPFAGLNTDDLWAQRSLLAELRQRQHELENKRRSVKKWKKVWDVIFISVIVALLTCSVILAAVASPAATTVAATAAATAMKAVEPCINSVWGRWKRPLQQEKDVIAAMQKGGGVAVHELDNVRSIVEKLKIDFDAMVDGVDFVINREEEDMAVNVGIKHLMAKKGDVEKGIDSLKKKLVLLDGEIRKVTPKFLESILKDI